jgi:hypothetical protein
MRKFFEQSPESASLFLQRQNYEKYVKSKYHNTLTTLLHEHLKLVLIIGTTKFEPNVDEILCAKLLRTSHWWANSRIQNFCSARTLLNKGCLYEVNSSTWWK